MFMDYLNLLVEAFSWVLAVLVMVKIAKILYDRHSDDYWEEDNDWANRWYENSDTTVHKE